MKRLIGQVSSDTKKGGRPHQEDRLIFSKKRISDQEFGWLLAIMDGHGGNYVAEYCAKNLEIFFEQALNKKKEVDLDVLRGTVNLLNESTRHQEAGSTISLAFISETSAKALVAILGDSPVLILDRHEKINIGPEHNVRTNLKEKQAAISRGAEYSDGYIYVGDYGLQMSRALGDSSLDEVLSREAEVYEVELGDNSFVLVASDGIFDPSHYEISDQINRIYAMIKNDQNCKAEHLVKDAISRRTEDNATAIIWRAI